MDAEQLAQQVAFRKAFLGALLVRLPSWQAYVSDTAGPEEPVVVVQASGGTKLRFEIYLDTDTARLYPFCKFGLDYTFMVSLDDLEQRSHIVFARLVSQIVDFAEGKTFVRIKRGRWLFMKAGWDVRFAPMSEIEEARRAGASIVVWDRAANPT